jgi:hypothetical protein
VTSLVARAALGASAGLVAGYAMNQVHALFGASESSTGAEDAATVKIAERIFGPLEAARRARAGSLAHYLMAATTGAVYAIASRAFPVLARGRGTLYGGAVWLVGDETLVPAFGLAGLPWRYPAKTHVRALVAHLVYGVVLDQGVRSVTVSGSVRRRP